MVWSTILLLFSPSVVETIKVLALVLVVGLTINWKTSLLVVGTSILTLAVMVVIFGSTLVLVIPIEALRFIIGIILLIVFFLFEKFKPNVQSDFKLFLIVDNTESS